MEDHTNAAISRARLDSTQDSVAVNESTNTKVADPNDSPQSDEDAFDDQLSSCGSLDAHHSGSVQGSLPSSGTQTPAICRPFLRRRASHEPDNLPTDVQYRGDDSMDSVNTSRRGSAAADEQPHRHSFPPSRSRGPVGETPRPYGPAERSFPQPIPSASNQSRPTIQRRVSSQIQEREALLQAELEHLREKLKTMEAQQQRESGVVDFAVNRIFEYQQNTMRVQQQLLDRFDAMDLSAADKTKTKRSSMKGDDLDGEKAKEKNGMEVKADVPRGGGGLASIYGRAGSSGCNTGGQGASGQGAMDKGRVGEDEKKVDR